MDVAARAVNGRTVAGTYIGRSRTLVSNSTCGRGAMVGSSTCGRGANLSYGPSDRSLGFEMEIQEDDGSAHSEAADLECSGRVSTRNENNNRPAAGKRSIFLADKSPVNDKMLGIHQPGSQDKTVREVAGSQPSQDSSQTRAQHPRTDESPHADEGSGIPNSESAQNHDDCYWVTGKNDSEAIMRQQEQEECKTSAEINFPCLMESRSLFTVDRSVPQQSEETGDGAQNFSHAFHCAGTQHLSQANNCNTGDDDGQEENDTTLSSKSDAIAEKTYHFLNSGFVAHDQEGACTTSMDRSWNADLETNAETTYDFLSKGKASAAPAECDVSRVPNPLQKSSNDHMSFNTVTEEYQAETSACVQGSRWPKNTPGSGNSNNDTGEDHGHGDPGQESDDPSTYCGQEREYQYEHPAQYQQVRYQQFQRKCSTQQHEEGYQREEEISPNCHGTYGQPEYDGGPPTQVSDAAIHEEMYRGQNEENPARLYHDGMYRQDHQGQFTTEDPDAEHEEKPSTPHHEEVYKSHNDEGCVSQDEIRAQFDGTYRQEYEGEVTAQKSDANKHHRDLATATQFCNSQSLGGTEENCAASTPQSYTDAIYYTLVNQGGYFASQSDVLQQGVLQGDSTSPNILYQGGTGQGSPTGYPKVPAGKGENFSKSVDGQLQLQPGFGHVYPFFSQVPGTDPGFHTKTVTAGPDHAPATESEECSQMRNQRDSEGFPHQPLRMQTGTQIHGFPVEGHDGLDDDTRQTQLQFSSHGGEEMKPSDRFIGLHGNEWLHRTMDSRGQNLAQEKEVEICMQCHGGAPPVSTLHNHIHSLRPFMKDNPHGLQLNFQNHAPKNPDGEKDMVDSNQGMRPENHEGQCEGDNYNDSVREGGSDFSAQWDASAQSGSEHNQHQVPAEVDVHEDASQGDFENEKFPDPKGEEVPAHDPEDAEFADLEDKDSEYEDDDDDYFRSEELDEDDEDVDFDFENACDSPYPPYVTAEVLGEYGLQDFPMWISEDDELAEMEEFFCEALTFSRPKGDDREPVYAQPVETDGISLSDSFDAESFEQNIKIGSQDFMASLHLNASNTLGERKKIFEEYINEIDDWYIEYCSALESVNSEFNAAVSFPFSRSYTQYPRYEFSRRLRRYRDAFAEHLIAVKRALGEEARVPSFNAKLRARKAAASRQAQEERLANEMVNFNPSAWRPQRGLPDKAVAVLKSWLFGNFLHPYPKDSDKDQLAKATGLTRGQVSNWFINARVRVWKPMIEDMYRMEYPEDTDPVSIAGDDAEEEEFPNEDGTTALPNDDGGGAISNRLNKRQCMDSSSYSCHDRSDYTEEVPQLPDEAAAIIALLPQPPNVLQQQRSDPILASSTVEGDYKTEQPQAYEVPHGSIRTGRHQASRAFAPYSREMLAQFLRNAAVTRHLGPNQDQTQDQAPVDPRFIGQRFNENQVSLKLELCSDRDSGATVSEPLPPATAAGHELQDVHHPQVKMEDEHRTEAVDGHMGPESLNLDLEKRERIRKGKRILTEMA